MLSASLQAHKKQLFIFIILLAAAAGAWFYWHQPKATPLTLHGNVDVRQVSLTFNASERIASMNVEEGDRVHQGQVLATLNTTPLELTISRCQAQIAQQEAVVAKMNNGSRPEEIAEAAASVQSAQAEADNAAADYQRMSTLYAGDAISRQTWMQLKLRPNRQRLPWPMPSRPTTWPTTAIARKISTPPRHSSSSCATNCRPPSIT